MRPLRRLVLPAALVAALGLTAFAVTSDSTVTPAPDPTAASSSRGEADAATRFRELVPLDAADLEAAARAQSDAYRRQAAAADGLKTRVDAMEAAGQALFAQWETELATYADDSLRTRSRAQLDAARTAFATRLAAMRAAQQATAPALAALHDRALALNHALDARAVGALDGAAATLQTDAAQVQRATEAATADADRALAGVPR